MSLLTFFKSIRLHKEEPLLPGMFLTHDKKDIVAIDIQGSGIVFDFYLYDSSLPGNYDFDHYDGFVIDSKYLDSFLKKVTRLSYLGVSFEHVCNCGGLIKGASKDGKITFTFTFSECRQKENWPSTLERTFTKNTFKKMIDRIEDNKFILDGRD